MVSSHSNIEGCLGCFTDVFCFCSAAFQAGGLVVMLVEVSRKAYLASIVPVIVNAILNEHQIIVDIVAFVNKGDFPRSRLGEKQRGKILAGWVSRKMRTIAQFAIKDMDSPGPGGPPGTSGGDGAASTPTQDGFPSGSGEFRRASIGSFRSGGMGASSLRNTEAMPQPPRILEQRELEDDPYRQYQPHQQQQQQQLPPQQYPGAPVEMPADELHGGQGGFVQSPEEQNLSGPMGGPDSEQTPTKTRYSSQSGQPQYNAPQYQQPQHQQSQQQQRISGPPLPHGFELPDFDQFGDSREASLDNPSRATGYVSPTPPPPNVGPKPGAGYQGQQQQQQQPFIRLPGVDGRESLDDWDLRPGSGVLSETSGTLMGNARPPSFETRGRQEGGQDDWARDAFSSLNRAGRQG